MKKYICSLLIVFLLIPLSLKVSAETYTVKDLSISIDDSNWDIFTRDNIRGNSKLDELGIPYDYFDNIMKSKDIYLDACKFDKKDEKNDIELFVVIKKLDEDDGNKFRNLHTYSDDEIRKNLEEKLKDFFIGVSSQDIYSIDKYKYIHVKQFDSTLSMYCDKYVTVINGYVYTIFIQKSNPFSTHEENNFKNIINSANFNCDPNYETQFDFGKILQKGLKGALIGALATGVGVGLRILLKKKKKS